MINNWDASLPAPLSENWRMAYGAVKGDGDNRFAYLTSDTPAQTSYQAPHKEAVPFIYESLKVSGGSSVDTAEYPFYGLWSSMSLNEKPQAITVSGFIRGDEYIKNRNALVEAVRITTTDDEPGYLTLPLWGRFPVIVIDWDIEESAKELGQCKVSLTFTRAGYPVQNRWEFSGSLSKTIPEAADAVKNVAETAFVQYLKNNLDEQTLLKSFNLMRVSVLQAVGRIQGGFQKLNEITNAAAQITNLIAQGIRSPKTLALALFGVAGKMVASVLEIKNASEETAAFFRIKNNEKNLLLCLLPADKYQLPVEAVTVKQIATKQAAENLYKTVALYTAAQLLPGMPAQSYNRTANLFALYDRLEKSIDLNDPAVYSAVQELRQALSQELAAKQLAQELSITLGRGMPLLALAQYLGAEERILRALNVIEDSFVIQGAIRYV